MKKSVAPAQEVTIEDLGNKLFRLTSVLRTIDLGFFGSSPEVVKSSPDILTDDYERYGDLLAVAIDLVEESLRIQMDVEQNLLSARKECNLETTTGRKPQALAN